MARQLGPRLIKLIAQAPGGVGGGSFCHQSPRNRDDQSQPVLPKASPNGGCQIASLQADPGRQDPKVRGKRTHRSQSFRIGRPNNQT
jgi:hypothetical protein